MLASEEIAWTWYGETQKGSEGHGIHYHQHGSVSGRRN